MFANRSMLVKTTGVDIRTKILFFHKSHPPQSCIYLVICRAVTIHQTHDSVRITIFDPRFGSYHDFFVGGKKKKNDFYNNIFY